MPCYWVLSWDLVTKTVLVFDGCRITCSCVWICTLNIGTLVTVFEPQVQEIRNLSSFVGLQPAMWTMPSLTFCIQADRLFTSPTRLVAKYCDECVYLSVCLCVCLSVWTTRMIFTKFFVHVAYLHGSVLLQHVYDRPHRLLLGRVFFPIDNALVATGIIWSPIMSCSTKYHSVTAAFPENGIGREGGDGSAQHGRSVIYSCLVSYCERFLR